MTRVWRIAVWLIVTSVSSGKICAAADFVVLSVNGRPAQMYPMLHVPTHYLRTGDRLADGVDFLMLPKSTVVIEDKDNGDTYKISGPNRVRITAGKVVANDPELMKVKNKP